MSEPDAQRVSAAFDAALRGDFDASDALRSTLPADGIGRLIYLVMDLAQGRRLDNEALLQAPLSGDLDARACAYHLLAAAIRFDVPMAKRLAALQRSLVGESLLSRLLAERADIWCDYLDGRDIRTSATQMGERAAEAGAAALRIEATVLGALAALPTSPMDAVRHARRATRMARAEGLVHHEYLSNCALARARRFSGRPHLSARIVAGLAPVVPSVWKRWVGWESALCGAEDLGLSSASATVRSALHGASTGEAETARGSFDTLLAMAGDAQPFRAEVVELHATLVPQSAAVDTPWTRGEVSNTWDALCADEDDSAPQAYIYVDAQGHGRRFIAPAAGLLPAATPRVNTPQRKDARVMRGAAALGLASRGSTGDGVDEATWFARVYGFEYEAKHESLARVLLHRVRALLGDLASVERVERTLCFRATHPLLIADPWCSRTLEQRVMMLLGTCAGELTAPELATALGVSTRQAQRALKSLNEAGVCSPPAKRGAGYRIDDTTFSEPTRSRVMPPRS